MVTGDPPDDPSGGRAHVTGPGHRVTFTPSGLSGSVPTATSVLDAARMLGVDLDSVCGGRGICGRCQVRPAAGAALSPAGTLEGDYRGRRALEAGNRLACAAHLQGDAVVDVPVGSQIHKQVIRKELGPEPLDVDPIIDLFYVEVPEPGPAGPVSEMGLLQRCLAHEWDLTGLTVAPQLLPRVHAVLRESRAVTVVVHRGRAEIVNLRPGYVDTVHGLAVDIGSTTIAGYLCDLHSGAVVSSDGRMNPQIRFGEDVMSRVSHAMTVEGGAADLTAVAREAIDGLLGDVVAAAGIERRDVAEIVLVGNPVMHHIVLGIDPAPLGVAPFTLATAESVRTSADAIGVDCPDATVHVLPCIGGHIGADTVAAALASRVHLADEPRLMVDVGTNAEIVLGDGARMFAAPSPTGPALEGAQISCGMRATAGAVERIRIDRDTLEPRLQVIGAEPWSDDSEFDAATAHLDIAGLCGSAIVEIIGELFLAGILAPDGTIRDLRHRTPRIVADGRTFSYVVRSGPKELRFTQADVRAVQLAKAALRAGIDLVCERAGVAEVAQVSLAGAFGSHIDPLYAILLGLVPDGRPESVVSVGNAAGAGAVEALLSARRRAEADEIAACVQRVETATEPRFQELFVAAMAIPHAEPTPVLATLVDLPESSPARGARPGSRRRRRAASRTEREERSNG
jgi:uncharacterized 2Fe-2S/4Fe-4S cluster protein (DUF4445 family)